MRARLILAFLLPLLALAGIGLAALGLVDRVTDRLARVANENIMNLNQIEAVSAALSQLRVLDQEYLYTTDIRRQQEVGQKIAAEEASVRESLAAYQATGRRTGHGASSPLLEQRYASYASVREQMMALASRGQREDALRLFYDSSGAYRSFLDEVRSLHRHEAIEAQGVAHEGYSMGLRSRHSLIGGVVGGVVLVFAVGIWFSGYVRQRLRGLNVMMSRAAQRDFSYTVQPQGNDEFASLARAFNVMTSSLRESEEENASLHAQSLKLREERIALLQAALRKSVEAQENERHRFARELHDQVGQSLAILQLALSRLQKAAPTPEAAQSLADVREMALEVLKLVRQVSLDLRPGMLDDAGLVPTLREFAEIFSERTGISVEVVSGDWESRLPPELEVTAFRIVQEAMTNVAKHASASRVRIGLSHSRSLLEVSIEDDGSGFNVDEALKAQRRQSLGLFGMEERCRLSGGSIEIVSKPKEGTRVVCRWLLTAVGPQDVMEGR